MATRVSSTLQRSSFPLQLPAMSMEQPYLLTAVIHAYKTEGVKGESSRLAAAWELKGGCVSAEKINEFILFYSRLSLPLRADGSKKDYQQHHKDSTALALGWCYPLLDVPKLRLREHPPCAAVRNGLDMDAVVVSVRYPGTDVPRLAMETGIGTIRRTSTNLRQHLQHLPLLCRQPHHPPCRRVCSVRSAETLR